MSENYDHRPSPPSSLALSDEEDDADLRSHSARRRSLPDTNRSRRSSIQSETSTLNGSYAPSVLSRASTGQLTYADESTEAGQGAQYASQYVSPRIRERQIAYDRYVAFHGEQEEVSDDWHRNFGGIHREFHRTQRGPNVADWAERNAQLIHHLHREAAALPAPPPLAPRPGGPSYFTAPPRAGPNPGRLPNRPISVSQQQLPPDAQGDSRSARRMRETLELMNEGTARNSGWLGSQSHWGMHSRTTGVLWRGLGMARPHNNDNNDDDHPREERSG